MRLPQQHLHRSRQRLRRRLPGQACFGQTTQWRRQWRPPLRLRDGQWGRQSTHWWGGG